MNWYLVEKEYVNYLHSFDERVENIEYKDRMKPYIGIILEINDFKYYVPVSSAKEKYYKMKNGIDLYKIENNDRILGVLNINNMIPIKEEVIKRLNYKYIEQYRKFANKEDRDKYIKLLSKELKMINSEYQKITNSAYELYNYVIINPHSSVAKRSCNFKLLEEVAKRYRRNNVTGDNSE